MKLLIVIPVYNEEGNIIGTISDIRQNLKMDYDILVVDDCSTDNSKRLLDDESVPYISLCSNLGIGGGVQAGYKYALENGYDIVVQFDGDGQHSAKDIPRIIEPILSGKSDYVIGSRFISDSEFKSTITRRFGIRFLSWVIHILCGACIYDVTSGLRATNKKLTEIFAEEYAQDYPEPEAIVFALEMGAIVSEVPANMKPRGNGRSSINLFQAIYYMTKVTIALFTSHKYKRYN